MKIKEIAAFLESIAPLSFQESYDNCGLLVGNEENQVRKALITLDCTEAVVEEAIRENCDLIIAHHPIIFSGLKKLNGKNYVERTVISAIKNNIAIYAIHTNYDNVWNGVNAKIAERLGLTETKILVPKSGLLKKLQTYIPVENYDSVSGAVFAAGAGQMGNYSETAFRSEGTGQYRGNSNSHPAIGKAGALEKTPESKFETIFPAHLESAVVKALLNSHPYEEVAYDLIPVSNAYAQMGSGMIGKLPRPLPGMEFLKMVKGAFQTGCVRHTAVLEKPVETVAICGGSGNFLLSAAKAQGADALVTADFKYHEFFDAENRILIADVGHFESEQFTRQLLYQHLTEKFPTFALHLSETNTNPVNYL
ncbi:MAG: Nif3-like dinuclear metal center hexameric protein [Chitinophagales bacterium]